jgi:hypothetical protein
MSSRFSSHTARRIVVVYSGIATLRTRRILSIFDELCENPHSRKIMVKRSGDDHESADVGREFERMTD